MSAQPQSHSHSSFHSSFQSPSRSQSPAQPASATAVRRARALFKEDKYEQALAQCTRAIHTCPCNGVKCDDLFHILALDIRAATFEALGSLSRARRDAERLVKLAPHRFEPYLRLGKVLSLQENLTAATKVYGDGVEMGKQTGQTEDVKFEKLHSLWQRRLKYLHRRDPIDLPLDAAERIFSYLNTIDLCICMRVSARWEDFLRCRPIFWRRLEFPATFPRRPPTADALKALTDRCRDKCASLVLHDATALELNHGRFNLLLAVGRNVRHLALANLPVETLGKAIHFSQMRTLPAHCPWVFARVTHLTVTGCEVPASQIVADVISRSAHCLESLATDVNFGLKWSCMPTMPQLSTLKLMNSPQTSSSRINSYSLSDWVNTTPNLQRLLIVRAVLKQMPRHEEKVWSQLESITLVRCAGQPARGVDASLEEVDFVPCDTERVRQIDIDLFVDRDRLLWGNSSPLPVNIEYFRWVKPLGGQTYRNLLSPSLVAGGLREVYLTTEPEASLDSLSWIAGAPSVRSLTLSQLSLRGRDGPDQLVDFVNSFPNLEEFGLLPETSPGEPLPLGVLAAVERIMRGGVKVVRLPCYGVPLDMLRDAAAECGVEFRWDAGLGEARTWLAKQEGVSDIELRLLSEAMARV